MDNVLYAQSGISDRHRLRCSSYSGCQTNLVEMRFDLFLYRFIVIESEILFGAPAICPLSRCRGPETRRKGRDPRFTEISAVDSLRVGMMYDPHRSSCKFWVSSNKCLLSPLDGYCASSHRPSSPHALSQLQHAGLSRFIVPTKGYVRGFTSAWDVVDAVYTKAFGRVTAATRTNERIALVDFYAEYVFESYDAIICELMM